MTLCKLKLSKRQFALYCIFASLYASYEITNTVSYVHKCDKRFSQYRRVLPIFYTKFFRCKGPSGRHNYYCATVCFFADTVG